MGTVDDYLASLDDVRATAYRSVLAVAETEAPDAVQGTSYGMAALVLHGKPLLGFKASKDHLGLYPFSPASVEAAAPHLEGFSLSKGTVRFDVANPIPEAALRTMLQARIAEIG